MTLYTYLQDDTHLNNITQLTTVIVMKHKAYCIKVITEGQLQYKEVATPTTNTDTKYLMSFSTDMIVFTYVLFIAVNMITWTTPDLSDVAMYMLPMLRKMDISVLKATKYDK